MKVSLQVVKGKPLGMEIPVKGPKFLIGRDEKCNLRPNNQLISLVHCGLKIDEDKVILADKGSKNGTYVNGRRVERRVRVKDGDLIKLGTLVFALKIVHEKPAPKIDPEQVKQEDSALGWLLDEEDGAPAEPNLDRTMMDVKSPKDELDDDEDPEA